MVDSETAELQATLNACAADLKRLMDESQVEDQEAAEEALRQLQEYGLDFYVTGVRREDQWSVTGWVLEIATGGPHYELRSDGRIHGWGWFGANKCDAWVDDDVVAYFEQWADDL